MKQTDQRLQTMCLLTITFIALGAAMYWLRPVMIPFVLAIFLTVSLSPVIDLLIRRLHFPRIVAIIAAAAIGVTALFLLGSLVSASVAQMTRNATRYQARMIELIDEVADRVPLEKLGVDEDELKNWFIRPATEMQAHETEGVGDETPPVTIIDGIPDAGAPMPDVADPMRGDSTGATKPFVFRGLGGLVSGTISAVMSLLSNGVLVLIFMMFMLAGTGGGEPLGGIWDDIRTRIQRYILTKVLVSSLTGILVGVTLWILGIELALVFGVLACLFNFIPSIGSIIATLLPLPVVLLAPDTSMVVKALAIAIPGVIQFSVGNIIEPKVMGHSLDLHPVTILLALMFFGALWGMVGMFLATPITAVIRILFEKLDYTRPLALLMAGNLRELAEMSPGVAVPD